MSSPSTLVSRSGAPGNAYGHYYDDSLGCTVVVTTPSSNPALWLRYLAGARRSYAHHDVTVALEYDNIRDGLSTSIFFCALDEGGRMLAGNRVQGPYTDVRQTHADAEWQRTPEGRARLRQIVTGRLDEGVIELKSGWVDRSAPRERRLVDMIAHSGPLSCSLLGVRYALSTAADHAIPMWQRTGAVVSSDVEPTPYPDDRYRTKAMWWDLETYRETATSEHVHRIDLASEQLATTWSTSLTSSERRVAR